MRVGEGLVVYGIASIVDETNSIFCLWSTGRFVYSGKRIGEKQEEKPSDPILSTSQKASTRSVSFGV
jgi:hypothetical protein